MLSSKSSRFLAAATARRSAVLRRRWGSDMPVPQSANAKIFAGHPAREGWEWTIAWWYPTSFIMIVAILTGQPEDSINAWAEQEAAARLALREQGMTDLKFGVHYQNLNAEQLKGTWDDFSKKSTRMSDEDDDDDDDEDDDDE